MLACLLQDLPPRLLLALDAIAPLALLVLAFSLPRIAQLVFPKRWINAIANVVASPASHGTASRSTYSTSPAGSDDVRAQDKSVWTLMVIGAIEAVGWSAGTIWAAVETVQSRAGKEGWKATAGLAGIVLGWVMSILLLVQKRRISPCAAPLLQFSYYALHLVFLGLHVVSLGLHAPERPNLDLLFTTLHAIALAVALGTILSMPLSPNAHSHTDPSYAPLLSPTNVEPSSTPDSKETVHLPSPESEVTLGSWIIFSWIGPLIDLGKKKRLGYGDVWSLPYEMSLEGTRATSPGRKYKRLIPQIFFNNSQDLILSLTLGILSSFLSYCSPYFLKQILQSLSPPAAGEPYDPDLRKSAYVYGLLAFVAQLARAEVDLQQLWHERRAIIRTRGALMGQVYEKALKRRDPSGAVGDDKDKKEKKVGEKGKKAAEEGRGTSSTGKIVSLMGGDTNKIAMQLMTLSSLVTAPFELVIAIAFLYQLLGWTSIAGLSILAVSLPLNQMLVKRRIKLHRSMLSARDSRMEVINELFNAIRFVKYSANEDMWLDKVNERRETELGWLLKTRLNNLNLNILWNFTPDLVMLISFACFTLIRGQELTVPVAFTSLALFALVRGPMATLPMSITGLLQTYVCIQRLEQFFEETEVDSWVSALREETASSSSTSAFRSVGITNGTFRYNEEAKAGDDAARPTNGVGGALGVGQDSSGSQEPEFELKDISVAFPEGKLSLVVGPTGSGKSSLFLALLGEMTCLSGEIHLRKGTAGQDLDPLTGMYDGVAYAAQLPWLQHDSIKNVSAFLFDQHALERDSSISASLQNILFGSPYDRERYEQVIEACALKTDLQMFDAGDETDFPAGKRTVLLDDPLSAVDSHTARHLYRKCLKGPLLEARTVVLVTHHISLCLGGSDYLVRISDGRIAMQGAVADLDKSEITSELVVEDEEAANAEVEDDKEKEGKIGASDPKEVERAAAKTLAPPPTDTPAESYTSTRAPSPALDASSAAPKGTGKLVEEEARATGRVKWKVYALYLGAAGLWTWFAIVGLIFAGRAFRVADRWWFRLWGESNQLALSAFDAQPVDSLALPELPSASDHVGFFLAGYLVICLLNLALTILGILAAFNGSFKASRTLFTNSLTRVVHAPFRYFDQTPVGRILNRYSQDFSTIDTSLTDQIRMCLTHAFGFITNVAVIVIVSPRFVPAAILIIWGYVRYSLMVSSLCFPSVSDNNEPALPQYVKASRDLRRLESVARSPIFSKFGETLHGIVTCRAFGAERRFLAGLFEMVDKTLACSYANAMTNRFLLLRFDTLGAIAVGITTVLSLVAGASPGLAALAITSAQSLVHGVNWRSTSTVRVSFSGFALCSLTASLSAVERVTDLLSTPQEPPQIIEGKRPPANWPSSVGGISVENLTITYAPALPPVIKNLSAEFPPRSKIGLVGRTGSGKSTLATALLRFVDPSEGRIVIDGIDISMIGLHDLRSAITLIPQEAVREASDEKRSRSPTNLDPFDQHTDAECLEVLERVGLSSAASLAPTPSAGPSRAESPVPPENENEHLSVSQQTVDGSDSAATKVNAATTTGRLSVTLTTPVSAGGHNFSDESTASVDFETDENVRLFFALSRANPALAHHLTVFQIQHTIREEFSDSLVVTIAHRLRTIIGPSLLVCHIRVITILWVKERLLRPLPSRLWDKNYDKVLVLDKGEVAEFDTPLDLLRNEKGIFRSMCEQAAEWPELKRMVGLQDDA
ncbi:SPOSA6832_01630 [Sporobolomyces salmonicolor]|uniref:SPOSA6832_01630-mRNA-1:cds n=1 Tax=Sporidiobolus salmonicolor TaxID=5005 RepID=A0A0D6EJ78_SPOSA|nr:SPOSA6832_01630 [Sporobolomyces salmonicolor]